MNLKERSEVIKACKYVDNIILNAPLIIDKEFIKEHNINMVVHAHNINNTIYDEMYKIPIELGIFKRIDYHEGVSTTSIKKTYYCSISKFSINLISLKSFSSPLFSFIF